MEFMPQRVSLTLCEEKRKVFPHELVYYFILTLNSYVRTDYALASALGTEGINQRWIMISYDIWCQYRANLRERFETRFPHLAMLFSSSVRGAIPKMHIYGHGENCQVNHSFTYTPYSGMTCGEGIESAWAEQNHAAGSTKEQSSGHRQDTLDDFNAYWNWSKVHQLRELLHLLLSPSNMPDN
jgi:hypothetical protein